MNDALLLAFIFLLSGVIAVPIASRLGLGSVLGYLIAGVLISPMLSLLKVNIVAIQHVAELGVVLMLFLVGLELRPQKLWELRTKLLGLGGGQVALSALAIMGVAMLFELDWRVSLATGLVLALSSTAIVLQTLTEKGLLKSDGGQSSFSVLLAQDIIVIPILAFIPLLAVPELAVHISVSESSNSHEQSAGLLASLTVWQSMLVNFLAIALVILSGRFLVSPVFRFIAKAQLRELFTVTALMFVVATTLLMSFVGLSPALGTFLAGVVLANSPYRHQLETDIAPFKSLLLGLFFMTVGAGINFQLLSSQFINIVSLTLGLILIKAGVLFVLARLFKIKGSNKWLFTLGLAQAGEFGFVLLSFTVASDVLPQTIADQLLLIIALSMLITPLLFILYEKVIAPRYAVAAATRNETIPNENKIIIAGSGRVGTVIDRMLRLANYHSTVIDFSVERLEALERFGVRNYYGDATQPDLLHAAGIEEASILIIAIDNPEQVSKLVKYTTKHYPNLHVIARAYDNQHVYDLWSYGCRDIIRENFDCSLRMSRSAYEALGIPREKADNLVSVFNDHDSLVMLSVADSHQVGVPFHENKAFIKRFREFLNEQDPQVFEQMNNIKIAAQVNSKGSSN
ncbi:cation:proton antiporter domain-containing protein [Marinomonas epiphytica]